ncbi:hypothetical protein ACTACV_10210 [Pseudomonas syringae]|uniref:hypothetical protein n=1 Tax=Pseudomonas syringae TaxID=317 RepID=UPI003F750687
MKIDWSKAPDGATHYDCRPHATPAFMQKIPDDSQRWNYWNRDGELIYYGFMPEDQVAQMVSRPQVWNGEGLPPVGAELEAGFAFEDFEKWHKGVCIAVGECPEGREEFCVVRFGKKIAMYTMAHGRMRPIRTAEQIAADEKRADIEAIVAAFRYTAGQCTYCLPYSSAERLYEIGVRLQVAP